MDAAFDVSGLRIRVRSSSPAPNRIELQLEEVLPALICGTDSDVPMPPPGMGPVGEGVPPRQPLNVTLYPTRAVARALASAIMGAAAER